MDGGKVLSEMASQGQQVLGDYLLIELVGEGGMAEVFRAQYTGRAAGHEPEVVLKRIKPELFNAPEFPIFREMFLNEAKLVHGLQHPNLARMHTLGEGLDKSRGVRIPFIVGEYIRGNTLRKYLGLATREFSGRGVAPAIAAFIIRDVARGLGAAHLNKDQRTGRLLPIIHRDVAPDNVMISTEGHIKVIDFGVAKAIGGFGPQTQTGIIKGKLAYMAPEQVAQNVVPATDVFGAGIILHEMLTGRRLFGGSNDFITVSKVLKAQIPPPSELTGGIPKELEQVLMIALSRDLSVRYVNGNAFADALTKVLDRVPALRGVSERSVKRWAEELLAGHAFSGTDSSAAAAPHEPAHDDAAYTEEPGGEIELSGEDVVFGGIQDVSPAIREAVTQGLRVLNLEMMQKSPDTTQPVPRPLLSESTARFIPPALHESERAPAAPSAIRTVEPPARRGPAPFERAPLPLSPIRTLEHPAKNDPAASQGDIVPVSGGQPVPDLGPAAALRSMRYFAYAIGALILGILIMLFLLNC
jgi:serine/threonine protein kinase